MSKDDPKLEKCKLNELQSSKTKDICRAWGVLLLLKVIPSRSSVGDKEMVRNAQHSQIGVHSVVTRHFDND